MQKKCITFSNRRPKYLDLVTFSTAFLVRCKGTWLKTGFNRYSDSENAVDVNVFNCAV